MNIAIDRPAQDPELVEGTDDGTDDRLFRELENAMTPSVRPGFGDSISAFARK
jgi:hypothetical protein